MESLTLTISLSKRKFLVFSSFSLFSHWSDASQTPYVCFQPFDFDPEWQAHGADPCQIACPVEGIWDKPDVYHAVRPLYSTLSWLSILFLFK